jgi:nicotinamidase-related amidase
MLQKLAPQTTALVLIDLQQGILGFAKAPRPAESVLTASARLAKRFREIGAPVALVRVGWSHDFGDTLVELSRGTRNKRRRSQDHEAAVECVSRHGT